MHGAVHMCSWSQVSTCITAVRTVSGSFCGVLVAPQNYYVLEEEVQAKGKCSRLALPG